MNEGWSKTYIGAVSYKKLVSIIVISPTGTSAFVTFLSSSGFSKYRSASSIFWKRSPRFAPRAKAAIVFVSSKDFTFETSIFLFVIRQILRFNLGKE